MVKRKCPQDAQGEVDPVIGPAELVFKRWESFFGRDCFYSLGAASHFELF